MLFNSFAFLIFFPTVVSAYFLIPHKFRTPFLLLASSIFYMWLVPWYMLVLLFLIVVDYGLALRIGRSEGKKRLYLLYASILATCSVLFVFKYYAFFNEVTAVVFSWAGLLYQAPSFSLILPIGLSFHTFQSLSYVIEVYRGRQAAERSFMTYALYVMFFPQLVAGPIERPQHLLHQFKEVHAFDAERLYGGLRLILWGLFKKVVVADRLAPIVDTVFDDPSRFGGLALMTASALFTLQIYLDFSGYSDIARGSARAMGFELMINFRRPFFAHSVADFWKRWHISLTAWFRDYVYIPLGGNRVSRARSYFNLILTFFLSGLWHGAHIHFAVWGLINGAYLFVQKAAKDFAGRFPAFSAIYKVPRGVHGIFTFMLIAVSFIFFRANSVAEAAYIVSRLPDNVLVDIRNLYGLLLEGGGVTSYLFKTAEYSIEPVPFLILSVFAVEFVFEYPESRLSRKIRFLLGRFRAVRWAVYYALILAIVIIGVHADVPFIYFQF